MSEHSDFLTGVIQGFYGPPWTASDRAELFNWMADWKLNTYLYAPKDDLKHRALWRERYLDSECEALRHVIQGCHQRKLRFVYALSPGLDIRYSAASDLDRIRDRWQQMMSLGCRDFALLFDDIPERLEAADLRAWGSLAAAQCHVTNTIFAWTRQQVPDARFLFCPTPYCGRMAQRNLGGQGYLDVIGRTLLSDIDVFWTGPEIISRDITVAQAEALGQLLRRKPLIWDNLHANDYDGRRFYCGPYSGRDLALRSAVSGILSNPNTEFVFNYVPLRTLAAFVQCCGTWNPRQAYLDAMKEWLPAFATLREPIAFEDFVLFGDCYYLPYGEGPDAEALRVGLERALTHPTSAWRDRWEVLRRDVLRLRDVCARFAELRHRPLFYALSRRIWELREELDLLEGCVRHKAEHGDASTEFRSDFHLPGTYRGGMVAKLQRLLHQLQDGTLSSTGAPGFEGPHPSA